MRKSLLDRRSFLGAATGSLALSSLPLQARANLAGERGIRLSTTWWLVSKMPVPDALALLARLGYDGYEMFDWRDAKVLETFVSLKDKYPLRCECLVGNKGVTAPGCGLVNPRERGEFLRQMNMAIEAAKKMECPQLVTLTGNELGGMPRSEQMTNAVEALRAIAPGLEKNGITAVVEILNTYVDHAGYFLYRVRDGAEMIDRVGSPNVKLLFDIYHVQIMEGNLIENIRNNIDRIGHFHIGDVPGRHEPGTGEINYRNVFKAIYELGDRYKGSAALEYGPLAPVEENLAAMRKMSNFV
ncbi:MAG TPA: TIM barrel protein [Terriglobia bacterium]|nr:TIM barrel protein [Terriglobia bacterium]